MAAAIGTRHDYRYYPKWGSNLMLKFNYLSKTWDPQKHLQPLNRFLYYSSILNLPKDMGMFILGGTD